MKSRVFTLTVGLAAFFSILIGFVVVAGIDTSTVARPGCVTLRVLSHNSLDSRSSSASATSAFGGSQTDPSVFFSSRGANVTPSAPSETLKEVEKTVNGLSNIALIRVTAGSRSPDSHRVIYVYTLSETRRLDWLTNGYPDVAPWLMATEVKNLEESARLGVEGEYLIVGSNAIERYNTGGALVDVFSGMGYDATASYSSEVSDLLGEFPSSMTVSVVLVFLLCVLLVSLGVFLGAQGYAVLRLHGWSWGRMWWNDIVKNWRESCAGVGVVFAVAVCVLWFVNRFAQFSSILVVSGIVFVAFLVVMFVFHFGCVGLCVTRPVSDGLKGAVPVAQASLDMYIIRIPAAIITLAAITSLAATGTVVAGLQSQLSQWGEDDGSDVGLLGGMYGSATSDQSRALDQWKMRRINNDSVIISYVVPQPTAFSRATGLTDDERLAQTLGGTILIVNSAYLSRQTVQDSSGNRIDRVPDGKVLLVVPESRAAEETTIEKTVRDHLHSHWEETQLEAIPVDDVDNYVDENGDSVFANQPGPDYEVVEGLAGQKVFDYHSDVAFSGNAQSSGPWAVDPIIIGMDPSCGVQNLYFDYNVYQNANGLLFLNPDESWQELTSLGLDGVVAGIITPTENLRTQISSYGRTLAWAFLAVVLAVVVLVASGVALARVHVRGRWQEVFVEYIHGWSFMRIHLLLVMCESVLFGLICVAGVVRYYDMARYQASESYYAVYSRAAVVAVIVVCVVSVVSSLVATAVDTRHLCRNRTGAL